MDDLRRRIAINCGGGYVPGLDAVLAGATLAARELGWEILGIHDGYDGLIAPATYPDGGLVRFDARAIDSLSGGGGSILGTAARNDPFRVRHVSDDGFVGEVDLSDELLAAISAQGIDAVIDRRRQLSDRPARAERRVQAQPQRPQDSLHSEVDRERCRGHVAVLRFQHRSKQCGREPRPHSHGGTRRSAAGDRGSPWSRGGMAGAAIGHRRASGRRAHSRDSL